MRWGYQGLFLLRQLLCGVDFEVSDFRWGLGGLFGVGGPRARYFRVRVLLVLVLVCGARFSGEMTGSLWAFAIWVLCDEMTVGFWVCFW